MYKQKGFNAGEGTGSSNPLKREIGGVEIRDSQYRGVRGNAKQRKLKRAKKGYNKARARLEEGKTLTKRQQRLMEEHQYNLDRQAEIKAGRESRQAASKARFSQARRDATGITEANPTSKKQQEVLDEYGFDPKGTPKDMPAVDVVAGEEKKKPGFDYQSTSYSNIHSPEDSKRRGVTTEYTNQQIKDMNSENFGKYDEYGVTKRYVKGKDGWEEQYGYKKGGSDAGKKLMEERWPGMFGKDSLFPTKEDGSKDYQTAYKRLIAGEPNSKVISHKKVSNEEGMKMIEEARKKQQTKPMTDDEYYAEARRLGTFDINHGRTHEK
jgi:hypothetical protein